MRPDLSRFLQIHLACFDAMQTCAERGTSADRLLARTRRALRADLAVLGAARSHLCLPPPGPLGPLALDYVLEGSRMGTRLLARRWAETRDPAVARARNYFTAPSESGRWRTVCAALSAVPVDSAEAETLVHDTKRLFDLFHRAVKAIDAQATREAAPAP